MDHEYTCIYFWYIYMHQWFHSPKQRLIHQLVASPQDSSGGGGRNVMQVLLEEFSELFCCFDLIFISEVRLVNLTITSFINNNFIRWCVTITSKHMVHTFPNKRSAHCINIVLGRTGTFKKLPSYDTFNYECLDLI